MSVAQVAFDIDALIHEADVEAAPDWCGAPLRYHEEPQWSAADLDAAWERYIFENGRFGCVPRSHMWHRMYSLQAPIETSAHDLIIFSFSLDTRDCEEERHAHQPEELPTGPRALGICDRCGWRTILRTENDVVEAWHDHAIPGWKELPVVPTRLRNHQGEKTRLARLHEWITKHYPVDMQQPGYPVISERGEFGHRHVPGTSPFGGYDLSDSALNT